MTAAGVFLTKQTSHRALPPGDYLKIPAVAVYLNISKPHAYALARKGVIPIVRFGRAPRVPRQAFIEMLDKLDGCSSGAVNGPKQPYNIAGIGPR